MEKFSREKRDNFFDGFILKYVSKDKLSKICDLACGYGGDLELLKRSADEIWGLDISHDAIGLCREKFSNDENVKLKIASAAHTGFDSDYFDFVIIRLGLHHIDEKKKVMEEAFRITKHGGKFIVIDKFRHNVLEPHVKSFLRKLLRKRTETSQMSLISKKEYGKIFSASKFRVLEKKILPYDRKNVGQFFVVAFEKI